LETSETFGFILVLWEKIAQFGHFGSTEKIRILEIFLGFLAIFRSFEDFKIFFDLLRILTEFYEIFELMRMCTKYIEISGFFGILGYSFEVIRPTIRGELS
jgi:hypothetical protein